MKKTTGLVLLLICALNVAGCGTKQLPTGNHGEVSVKIEESEKSNESEVQEELSEKAEYSVIKPLPLQVDVSNLDNCTVAISLEKGGVYKNEDDSLMMDATVYTYDVYDMVDISNLKEYDAILINKTEVIIESFEILESGLVLINGGMENGGYDLWHDESGVYFEHGYSDVKSYYEIGKISLTVSDDFVYNDSSDLDAGEKTFDVNYFLNNEDDADYYFNANNTKIRIENGAVVEMQKVYTP